MMNCKVLTLLICTAIPAIAFAQTYDALPYEYGFEASESAEQANWVLNPGTTIQPNDSIDRWAIGNAITYTGRQAMYISVDGGETCGAGSSTNRRVVQFAYRDFVLPAGQYYVSFDWMCPSMILYAGYVNFVNINSSKQAQNISEVLGSSDFPNVGLPSVGAPTSTQWKNANFIVNVGMASGGAIHTTRVWFAWVNDSARTIQPGLSAAIDNIQVREATCEIPSGFSGFVEDCDNVTFEWAGSSAAYEIQYRASNDTGRWRNRKVENGLTSITLSRMSEGVFDFRLRGKCFGEDSITGLADTTYSPYVYLTNFSIYCPELHCINFLDIKDTTWVTCTYGTSSSQGYQANANAPYQNVGCIDYGWQSKNSRHTIVTDTNALDPRTENQLRMVPHGEAASVRLGNWDYGNGTEAITYLYEVDGSNAILLVNYAIVLEDPQHGDDEVPRFIIKIRDEKGELVDPDCGVVDLNSNTQGGTGWSFVGSGYDAVVYKDWTTLGLNLTPYVGQKLTISFETFDCIQGGHYGYAYFTMDCTPARLKYSSCGNEESIKVTAPSGFYYQWYAGYEKRYRSQEQSIEIQPTDPTNWTCRLISTENVFCFFDLEINTAKCEDALPIIPTEGRDNTPAQFFYNGHIYITRNGKTYDVLGRIIQQSTCDIP